MEAERGGHRQAGTGYLRGLFLIGRRLAGEDVVAAVMMMSQQSSGAAGGELDAPLTAEAFAARFREHSRTFLCVAAAILGSPHEAEDVVQEAAAIAWSKKSEHPHVRSFRAWMTQIVRFVALNRRRGRTRRREAMMGEGWDIEAPAAGGEAPGSVVGSRGELIGGETQFDDRVMRALGSLGETARACLLLRVVLDMPYKEISRTLDIPEGTAMTHVARSRRALYERLSTEAIEKDLGGSDA
jgi:RNA polymerase sigma-70 factor (ECF subfamily)